jgi:group II intron reverse transcriptase/maturase
MSNKPFDIPRYQFIEAFEEVKTNKGAPGIDGVSIATFEEKLEDNLYKLWNRMSSGTYFPPAVKQVEIPKKSGGIRPLGIPTVEDRIAQTVVKMNIEPILEEIFIDESYGYRPEKSALDALSKTRERCWRYDWVVEFDIVGLFDNINHELLFKAVDKHIDEKWIRLYLKRWCEASVCDSEGNLHEHIKGVSQGGVTSPLLANLFMHYAFDLWMKRSYPACLFERYADDAVIHCETYDQAITLLQALDKRLKECHLKLHPEKTRIIYCKDQNRKGDFENTSFDFLGYTFRPRGAENSFTGEVFTSFAPAVSKSSAKSFKDKIRQRKLLSTTHLDLQTLANTLNPTIRGWMNYYGTYYPSEMQEVTKFLNNRIKRWARRKHKGMKSWKKANKWFSGVLVRQPKLFYHWSQGYVN